MSGFGYPGYHPGDSTGRQRRDGDVQAPISNPFPLTISGELSLVETHIRNAGREANKPPLFGDMLTSGDPMTVVPHMLVFSRKSSHKGYMGHADMIPVFGGLNYAYGPEDKMDTICQNFLNTSTLGQGFTGLTRTNFSTYANDANFQNAFKAYREEVENDLRCEGMSAFRAQLANLPHAGAYLADPRVTIERAGTVTLINWSKGEIKAGDIVLWKVPDLQDLQKIWFGEECSQHPVGDGFVCPILEVLDDASALTPQQRRRVLGMAITDSRDIGGPFDILWNPVDLF